MTGTKHILDGLTPAQQQAEIDRARAVLRELSEYVIDEFEDKGEKAYAVVSALVDQLTPPDLKNPPDDWPITAWRLAQVLEGMMGSTHEMQTARAFLLGGE